MGHFCAIFAVVHHQHFQILNIVHHEFVKSIGKQMPGSLGRAVSNIGHDNSTSFELSADSGINTLGPTPAFLDGDLSVALMSLEAVGALLHAFNFD